MRLRLILTLIAVVLAIVGCTARPTITPEESKLSFSLTYPMDKMKAYDETEVQLVTLFNNAKHVTQVKQRENGRIVIQALSGRVPLGTAHGSIPFVMDLKPGDKSGTIDVVISQDGAESTSGANAFVGTFPDDMGLVHRPIHNVVDAIAVNLGGQVTKRTPIPEPAKPTPGSGSHGPKGGKGGSAGTDFGD